MIFIQADFGGIVVRTPNTHTTIQVFLEPGLPHIDVELGPCKCGKAPTYDSRGGGTIFCCEGVWAKGKDATGCDYRITDVIGRVRDLYRENFPHGKPEEASNPQGKHEGDDWT